MTGDLYAYTALAGVGIFGLMIPALVWILTRAYYQGVVEDRDTQADKVTDALLATMRGECATATVERAEHAVALHRQARAGRRPTEQRGRHAR